MRNLVLLGDVREKLREIPDGVVQCCVTSPPYFGLRDYCTGTWQGGDASCPHTQGRPGAGRADGVVDVRGQRNRDGVGAMGGNCGKCGAIRRDAQVGLERTPDEYIANMVDVFREVRRVLRDDGTLWLNLGDSYSSMGPGQALRGRDKLNGKPAPASKSRGVLGLKEKDMIGIPWRVAFALQADGWYLRSDIIWAKGNPMPEPVTDRPTKAHEYIFLLTKSPRYFYDHEAVKEEALCDRKRGPALHPDLKSTNGNAGLSRREVEPTRNRRSVWTLATEGRPVARLRPDLTPEQRAYVVGKLTTLGLL